MPIDFTRFRSKGDQLPTRPRDIFNSLSPRAPGFGYLRDVQGQVLETWYQRRHERDLAIKMNTGTGKTVVGLLALLSSVNEGHGPALYVAPDKFLAQQVLNQARILGIEPTTDPESYEYLSGRAICIVNIHKLVNGLSVFGGPGSLRIDPIEIGCLVIDDAHACVKTVEGQTTVQIPKSHSAYGKMLKIFRSDLYVQSISQLSDLEEGVPGALSRVPMAAWADKRADVISHLQRYRDDEPLKFSWPFIKDILPACQAVFSKEVFEIHPFCPPTNKIISLERAKRRLYLTATLADDSVLVTHFGVSDDAARSPVSPSSAADIGDRLILSLRELDSTASDERIRKIVDKLARKHNVVVLVPSWRRAAVWDDYADLTVGAEEIADAVDSLKKEHVGVVVLVNKYDGIDLPDGACRILVIDGVPEAITNSERREAELLGGSDVLAYRKLQRIEQGMGRGVRSAEDYCVVLLLGASLASTLSRPQVRDRLGPASRAQLELSMDISRELSLVDLVGVIDQCLDRDEGWLEVSRECLAGVTYSGGSTEPFATFFREAFVAAAAERFEVACEKMRDAINSVDDDTTKGWLQEHLATYMHSVNPTQAQQTLAGAIKRNPRVMRPLRGMSYRRASSTVGQGRAVQAVLAERFDSPDDLLLGVAALVDRLTFNSDDAHDSDDARDFEDAIEELGNLLGFESQRPERDNGSGPDALWALGGLRFLVIECKSEATAEVWKRDAAQLGHSMNWFAEEYDASCKATPLLVHHSGKHADGAVPPPQTRVIDADHLFALCSSLTQLSTSLKDRSIFDSESGVIEVLRHHGLTAGDFVDRYTTKPI